MSFGSVNRVILIGNVGRLPEIRHSQESRLATFSIATNDTVKSKTGELTKTSEWHRIVVFNKFLVDLIEKHVHAGSKLYIEGSLRTNKWQDKTGKEVQTTEVVVGMFDGKIVILDNKASVEEMSKTSNSAGNLLGGLHEYDALSTIPEEDDDDLPF